MEDSRSPSGQDMTREPNSALRAVDVLFEASTAVWRRPVRTLLTALGTIVGVAAFVMTTGLAATASAQVSSSFDALEATEVRVQDVQPDGSHLFPADVDVRLSALNGVVAAGVIYELRHDEDLAARGSPSLNGGVAAQIPILAASPGALDASRVTVGSGVLYGSFHADRAELVAVLGRVAADDLGIHDVSAQPAVFIGSRAFTVVGIIDNAVRNPGLLLSVVIPSSTERKYFGSGGIEAEVVIDTEPGAASLIGRQAALALRPDDPERLRVLVPPDPASLRNAVESEVTALYYALAGLSLAIGTIAIANSTLLNTIERRSEIGLRRALGAKRSHIVRQVVVEASITGAFAGVVGAALAVTGIGIISSLREWTATIEPLLVAAAPILGLATGALAGVVPAARASRTPPAVTLRS